MTRGFHRWKVCRSRVVLCHQIALVAGEYSASGLFSRFWWSSIIRKILYMLGSSLWLGYASIACFILLQVGCFYITVLCFQQLFIDVIGVRSVHSLCGPCTSLTTGCSYLLHFKSIKCIIDIGEWTQNIGCKIIKYFCKRTLFCKKMNTYSGSGEVDKFMSLQVSSSICLVSVNIERLFDKFASRRVWELNKLLAKDWVTKDWAGWNVNGQSYKANELIMTIITMNFDILLL